MSDTPRTDDQIVEIRNHGEEEFVPVVFARILERELEQAKSELARLRPLLECQRIDLAKVGGSFKQFWEKAQSSPIYWQEAAKLADDEYRLCEAEIKVLRTEIAHLQAQLAECQAARARLSDPVADPFNSIEPP